MIYISKAIRELAPDATWSFVEDDLDNITWNSEDIPQPTKKAILAKAAEIEAREEAQAKAKEDAKVSAQAKLAKLGLTPDEVQAILGT